MSDDKFPRIALDDDKPLVTFGDVAGWIRTVLVVLVAIVLIGFFAGYFTERFAQHTRDVRLAQCINSACDQPCKPGARFVRHAGCTK